MAYNVLVVDDSKTSRKVIIKAARMAGLEVGNLFEAGNGAEALEILKENWIDLVFTDLNMPEMGGVELVERMAREDLLKDIPVIIVTSDRNQERLFGLLERGARAFLNKPFHPESLKEILDRALGSREKKD